MLDSIVAAALETGFIAALFVGLLIYVLRDSNKREQKYQEMITQLQQRMSVVIEIRKDVAEIKKKIDRKKTLADTEGETKT
jgi:preprotein translocase subunit YajC